MNRYSGLRQKVLAGEKGGEGMELWWEEEMRLCS